MSEKLKLFAGYGVEMEYMIVDADTLSVRPITDEVLKAVAGEYVSDVDCGKLSWSNELVLHVIELKTNGPAPSLEGLDAEFLAGVRRIEELLRPFNARLMPTGMHPWFDPATETRLWPHEYNAVYEAYNRIFNCTGHGWSNLQSTHLNLPFSNDEEFGVLHAAVRAILPIIPALSASTPVMDLKATGLLDNRMEVYRHNSKRIPSITGKIVPEAVFTQADYDREIFQKNFADIAPHDPDGILQDEFLNSRGAIARFGRGSVEIRVIDIQECPAADIAIVQAIVEVLKALCAEQFVSMKKLQGYDTDLLADILLRCVRDGEHAVIKEKPFLKAFGWTGSAAPASSLWYSVIEKLRPELFKGPLGVILDQGTLSTRILRRLGSEFDKASVAATYGELCDCLREGRMFRA